MIVYFIFDESLQNFVLKDEVTRQLTIVDGVLLSPQFTRGMVKLSYALGWYEK